MGVGGAVTAANAVASDASTARSAHAVPTISPSVDIDALWTELGQLSLADRANTFAALRPDVRARIHAAADELAAAAAH
jgi:hypothetical protein